MTSFEELAGHDALALADLVRKGDVTPIELVDATISRIERVNPELNAVVTPMYEEARERAKGPLSEGSLAGVPYLLKDLGAAYKGVRHTYGTSVLKDAIAPHDAEMVRRLRGAGLIVVGKTNTPELGCHITTEPRLFGATRNPWNLGHSVGGSSGGSAAAVASGIVPAAHANDGGGSIRIPASCCGVFGLKPTRARTTMAPDAGDFASGIAIDHAVTRSVRDSAVLLDIASGAAPGDPYWAPPPERPFLEEVGADAGRLRVAFATQTLHGVELHGDCLEAVEDAARLCQDLGHHVEACSPLVVHEEFFSAFETVFSSGVACSIDTLSRLTGATLTRDDFEPLTGNIYEMGQRASASQYLAAVATLHSASRTMAAFFQQWDLWLTPTLASPPVALGTFDFDVSDIEERASEVWSHIPFTPLCNGTGLPAMSVPLYWNADNLPIGAHFVAPFGDEATLYRLASQLEQARPWQAKRPAVHAYGDAAR